MGASSLRIRRAGSYIRRPAECPSTYSSIHPAQRTRFLDLQKSKKLIGQASSLRRIWSIVATDTHKAVPAPLALLQALEAFLPETTEELMRLVVGLVAGVEEPAWFAAMELMEVAGVCTVSVCGVWVWVWGGVGCMEGQCGGACMVWCDGANWW
eukprot:13648-Chlamydomonas_euryale.AAC.1